MTFAWSPQEVYLSELINRARANPGAEGARLGLDLSAGLTGAEAARLVAQEPLALNQFLTAAARAHSLDMAARNFFDHDNPDGFGPTARARSAGYAGTSGENIAGAYADVDAVHRAWLSSVDHRKNVLSLYSNFDASYHSSELGVGIAMNAGGAYNNYFTGMFGNQGASPTIYLLGVAFADTDGDNFYGIGEGAAGIRVDVAPQSAPSAIVATATTDGAGNYQLGVAAGAYSVTFTRLSDGFRVSKAATVGAQNLEVSAKASELGAPPDDYAGAGQWAGAGPIALDPLLGNGLATGAFEASGDTDLFRFVASRSGLTTITLTSPTGQFGVQVTAYNAAHAQAAAGTPGGEFGNGSVVSMSVVQGQTYYLLAHASNGTSIGQYLLLIQGPTSSGSGNSDDFANIGDLTHASSINVDALTGDAVKVGYLELAGDTDLFRLVTPREGSMTISLSNPSGAFGMLLRVFDSSGAQVATGDPGGDQPNGSTITFTTTVGQTYYLSAEAIDGRSLGLYTLSVQGPGLAPPPPPPIIVNDGHKPTYQSLVTTLYAGGKLSLVFMNTWNQPIVATANADGSWSWADLRGWGNQDPLVDGEVASWTDRRESINYFTVRGGNGLILFREDTPGNWSHRNLSEEIDLSLYISTDVEVFFDGMNRANIAGVSDGGDLIVYSQTLQRNPAGQYVWSFRNVTALDVEPRGLTMPFIASELAGWVTTNKSANLAFVDESGDLELFYRPRGKSRWSLQNLGDIAPTGFLVGELTVFQTAKNGVGIAGTDEDGHVWVTSYRENARNQGFWSSRDLTQRLAGTPFNVRSLTSYVDHAGFGYIAGIRSDGTLSIYRFNAVRNIWRRLAINLDPPDFRNMAGRLSAAVDPVSGEVNIVGTLDSFRLVRWTLQPGGIWEFEDVSYQIASRPPS